MRKLLVMAFCLLLPIAASAQHKVSGTVTDENGEALAGVNVLVKGTYKGAATNTEGRYSVDSPTANATLVFRAVSGR